MCEKYYDVSLYGYCLGNPIKFIDPDGKDVAILIAKTGAGGYGHMAAVIQNKEGKYYYMTVGNTDERAGTLSGLSSGADGGMLLQEIKFGKKEPNMENAIVVISETDTQNASYTDNVILKTSSEMDENIYKNAETLKKDFASKTVKYNALTNNCADAVQIVIEKGTGVDIPMGLSSKPNSNFEKVKSNQNQIQSDINEKIKENGK